MKKLVISLFMGLVVVNPAVNAACTEAQTALLHKLFYKGFSGGNMTVLEEVFHPEIEFIHPGLPPGLEGVKKIVQMNNAAFENWHFDIHDLFCDGEKAAVRYTGSGIHVGSFMGETPTNKEIQLNGAVIYLIQKNQIVKDWYVPDELSFLSQLGVIPPIKVK